LTPQAERSLHCDKNDTEEDAVIVEHPDHFIPFVVDVGITRPSAARSANGGHVRLRP
jgi:hypothetical protein